MYSPIFMTPVFEDLIWDYSHQLTIQENEDLTRYLNEGRELAHAYGYEFDTFEVNGHCHTISAMWIADDVMFAIDNGGAMNYSDTYQAICKLIVGA